MALTDKNLYAYCDNNPVIRKDTDGNLWQAIVIGAAVNVATSYFSALATGQEYGITDFLVAAVSGGVSSIAGVKWERLMPVAGGLISGAYAFIQSLNNGASTGEAFLAGAASFAGTSFTGGSIATMMGQNFSAGTSAVFGASFGFGGNLTSAAVYRSAKDFGISEEDSRRVARAVLGSVIGIPTIAGIVKKTVKESVVKSNKVVIKPYRQKVSRTRAVPALM